MAASDSRRSNNKSNPIEVLENAYAYGIIDTQQYQFLMKAYNTEGVDVSYNKTDGKKEITCEWTISISGTLKTELE